MGRSHARHRSDHDRSSVRNHPSTRPVTDIDTFLKENQAETSKVPSPSPTPRLSLQCLMVMSWGQKRHPRHLPRECPVSPPRAEPWLFPSSVSLRSGFQSHFKLLKFLSHTRRSMGCGQTCLQITPNGHAI